MEHTMEPAFRINLRRKIMQIYPPTINYNRHELLSSLL
jgi:hypothetical protein